MRIKHCKSLVGEIASDSERTTRRDLSRDQNLAAGDGLDEGMAEEEAKRCLATVSCEGCDLCRLFCPDLCITRSAETGKIEIDYDYCKGCGICAAICPRGAITMVLEEQ